MDQHAAAMLDGKTFAIGILAITACILFVGFLLIPQPAALAYGQNDRGGDFIMLTQQVSQSAEALVVVDAAAKQMIIYEFDYSNKTLEIVRQVPLDQLPKPHDREVPQKPEPRRQP